MKQCLEVLHTSKERLRLSTVEKYTNVEDDRM
uniref:Uncharacterized protein n=1 Tax=Rhizophora mucronata TaxID=61149 RepID=A0A2P2MXJ1_RHIMU